MASSAGTKVTSTNATKHESVGVVTADSLAAESLKGSGSFGEGNPQAAASKQPSKSTTTNTTDTSAATTLAPAINAEAREAQQNWNADSQLNAGRGLGKEAGRGANYTTNSAFSDPSGGAPNLHHSGVSGGYAGAADKAREPGELRPKGVGLTETSDMQGKTAFGDIGTDQDPSRLAEQALLNKNAQVAGAPRDNSNQKGTSKFSELGDESA